MSIVSIMRRRVGSDCAKAAPRGCEDMAARRQGGLAAKIRFALENSARSADQITSRSSGFRVRQQYTQDRIERPLRIIAAVAALVFAVVVTIGGGAKASLAFVAAAWVVAAVAAGGLVVRRPATGTVATLALLVTAVSGRWLPPSVSPEVIVGLMLMWSVVLVTFVTRSRHLAVLATAVLTFLAPLYWNGLEGAAEALEIGFVAAVVIGLVAAARTESGRVAQTAEAMFENAPVSMMEQDWSETFSEFDRIRNTGVTDFRSYLRSNPSEVGRLFSTAEILTRNVEASRVFPRPQSDGHHAPDTVDEFMFEGSIDLLVDFFEGRLTRRVIWPMVDDGGMRHWHQITSFPHPGGHSKFILVSTDVTEIKRAEETLAELVESKDRFVAAISHELRTPLAAVVGFTSELLQRPEAMSAEEKGELLLLANQQAFEAADIIADLLVIARADIGGVSVGHEVVDVRAEIDNVLTIHPNEIAVIGLEDVPAACADIGRVRQVLRNLLTNAVRYGGPEQRIVCSSEGHCVSIEVRDDGPELTGTEMSALFEPYTRAHQSVGITESVGLGLTVARHLADAMGGSLEAVRDNHETVFRLRLPAWGHCSADGGATAFDGIRPASNRMSGQQTRRP